MSSHKPLRTQFVITSLPVGGAEVLLLNMLRRIDRSVLEPEVVCLKEPGALGEEVAAIAPLHSNLLNSKWDLRVLTKLASLYRQRKTDAVITIGAGDKMFWGRLAAKWAGVPVICSALHSTGWPDGVGKLNRLLTPLTTGFIACAEGQADFLVEFEKFPRDKVFMIPNGVDVGRFAPEPSSRDWLRKELGVASEDPVVGIVAALRSEKNHAQFLQAASEVLKEHGQTQFVIVGEGPERESIEAESQRLGIQNRVHLLGNRSDTDRILQGLDVFCLTSRNEAKPVSILEALACGVPAVSPDVGSVSESVIPGETGILTEPLSSESTAQAITALLDDPSRCRQLGLQGRRHVIRHSSLEVMVGGYQNLVTALYRAAGEGTKPGFALPQVELDAESRAEGEVRVPQVLNSSNLCPSVVEDPPTDSACG